MNIFEAASRGKFIYHTNRGVLNTSDLWDLSLEVLDSMAIGMKKQLKEVEEESFIKTKRKTKAILEEETKFEIVKHIITVKLAEKEARKVAKDKKAEKARLLSLLAKKQDEKLEGMSEEELNAKLAALEE
jgi:hypothetical protein